MTGADGQDVRVDGRIVRVSSLDRVLWPLTGTTKAELIDYYLRVAPVLLPHLGGHPVTLHRFPDGVGGRHFFQTPFPKTSGGKGVHVYVPLHTDVGYATTKAFARTVARRLAAAEPAQVVDRMATQLRAGKVFIDWSQNDAGKSTVAPYSLRGLRVPVVSAPLTWDELAAAVRGQDARALAIGPAQALERVERHNDLFAPVLRLRQALPAPG